jgi:hypothetical protein
MNTRIGTSFGLALLLAVGVIATMLALGMFSAQKANAGAPVVTALTASPSDPGDTSAIKITFTTDEVIQGNSGEIWVRFDSGYTIPDTISKNLITITSVQSTGGTSNPLIDPTIQTITSTTDAGLLNDTIVKLTLGDTVPSSNTTVEDLHIAAGHIITFASSAGIQLPTGSSTTASIIRMSIDSGVTYGTEVLDIDTARIVTLSAVSGARGAEITATGKGFSSTGTTTLWIDDGDGTGGTADDGKINGTEHILASGIVVTSGSFTSTFTTDTNFAVGANQVNAIDGGGTAVGTTTNPTFTIIGGVSLDKTTVSRGGTIKVSLGQYSNGTVTSVTFGGVPTDLGDLAAGSLTIASNAGSLTVTVPTTTPLGTQVVAVTSTVEVARSTTVEVTGAPVTLSPSTAVPSQDITASGNGFTGSSTVATITVGGSDVPLLTTGAAVTTVTTDNSGNLVASFPIPNDATTRTAGTHKVKITDASGRVGEADLTVIARTLVLSTASSKRSSTVDASGAGYVAKSTITLTYVSGTTTTTVGTTTADSAGAWSASFTVPSTAGIPSANTVTATSGGSGAASEDHAIPGSTIVIDPTTAVSGNSIDVTGSNFPGFVSVTVMNIGGIAAIPTPAPATDTNGAFTSTILVPQLALGTHSVLITAGGISANTSITIEAAPAVTTPTTNATETVFADVIANNDNLVRVWKFTNADQSWSFYDPRAAFAAANTYVDASSGDIVWVNVTAQEDFQGQTLFAGWNLITLD